MRWTSVHLYNMQSATPSILKYTRYSNFQILKKNAPKYMSFYHCDASFLPFFIFILLSFIIHKVIYYYGLE